MKAKSPLGLRIIAIFKLVCAFLLAAVGIGLFRLLDRDMGEVLEHCVRWLHLDPARPAVTDLMADLSGIGPGKLRFIDGATFFYAVLYLIEGIGLLKEKHWAEYLVILATMSLVPYEIFEVMHKPDFVRIGILAVNLVIVAYLVRTLIRDRQARRAQQQQAKAMPTPTPPVAGVT